MPVISLEQKQNGLASVCALVDGQHRTTKINQIYLVFSIVWPIYCFGSTLAGSAIHDTGQSEKSTSFLHGKMQRNGKRYLFLGFIGRFFMFPGNCAGHISRTKKNGLASVCALVDGQPRTTKINQISLVFSMVWPIYCFGSTLTGSAIHNTGPFNINRSSENEETRRIIMWPCACCCCCG